MIYFYQDESDLKDFVRFLSGRNLLAYDYHTTPVPLEDMAWNKYSDILWLTYPDAPLKIERRGKYSVFSSDSQIIQWTAPKKLPFGHRDWCTVAVVPTEKTARLAEEYRQIVKYFKSKYVYSKRLRAYVGESVYRRWLGREVNFNDFVKRESIRVAPTEEDLKKLLAFFRENGLVVFSQVVDYRKNVGFDGSDVFGATYPWVKLNTRIDRRWKLTDINSPCVWLNRDGKRGTLDVFMDFRFVCGSSDTDKKMVELYLKIKNFFKEQNIATVSEND